MEKYSRSPKTDKDLKPCKLILDNIALQFYKDTRDKVHNQNELNSAVLEIREDYFYIDFADAQFKIIEYINYILRSLQRMDGVRNILVKVKGDKNIKDECLKIIEDDIKELILKIEIIEQIGIVWGLKSYTRIADDFKSQLKPIIDDMRAYINFKDKFMTKETVNSLKRSLKRKDKQAPLIVSYYADKGFYEIESLIEVYND